MEKSETTELIQNTSEIQKIDRRKTMPHLFKKGQSGNPAGKPVGAKHLTTLLREAMIRIANDKGETADIAMVKKLLSLATEGDLRAMELVWDRAEGKATQHVETTIKAVPVNDEQREKLESLLDGSTKP